MKKKICASLLSLVMLTSMLVFNGIVKADIYEDEDVDFLVEEVSTPGIATSNDAELEKKSDKGLSDILKQGFPYNIIISYKTDIAEEEELQENANKAQERTKAILEEGLKNSTVEKYESFYIINAIHAIINSKEVLEEIASLDEVISIENNEKISLPPSPSTNIRSKRSLVQEDGIDGEENFALFSENNVENYTWAVKNTRADRVWKDYSLRGDGITVGIMDTGVNYKLDELKHAYKGYDATTNTFDDSYYKDFTGLNKALNSSGNEHGTMVAASIVGKRNRHNSYVVDDNGKYHFYAKDTYYYGTAPNIKFINAKVLDKQSGNISNFIGGAEWLLEQKPDIINNSWGSTGTVTNKADTIMQNLIANWQKAGIVVIFASGNEMKNNEAKPGSIAYPANMLGVFSVGAINKKNKIWVKSQRGPSPYSSTNNPEIKPDVVAPGEGIETFVYDVDTNNRRDRKANGTSFAAPMTTGVAALIKQANPSLSANQIYNILRKTARPLIDDKNTKSPNMTYGYGAVDAYMAVSVALGKAHYNAQKKAWEIEGTNNTDKKDTPIVNNNVPDKKDTPVVDNNVPDKKDTPVVNNNVPDKKDTPVVDNNVPDKKDTPAVNNNFINSKKDNSQDSDNQNTKPRKEETVSNNTIINKMEKKQASNNTDITEKNIGKTEFSNNPEVLPDTKFNSGSSGGGGSRGGSRGGGGSIGASSRSTSSSSKLSSGKTADFITNKTTYNGKWELINGKWYLLDVSNTKIANAWVSLGGKWYALDANGVMAQSWTKINNKWYYFEGSGAMLSNVWLLSGKNWYYLSDSGDVLTNTWIKYNNKWYYLDSVGKMLSSTTFGNYRFDSSGSLIE